MIIYNTIMAIAAGAGLLTLVLFLRELLGMRRPAADGALRPVAYDGWALSFGVLAAVLITTGLHMTLVWPLEELPFDNIIFGEPALAFGLLMAALAFFLWRRRDELRASTNPLRDFFETLRPLTPFIVGMGLACIAILFAGNIYTLFAAPEWEPISGYFAKWPWFEAAIISGLYGIIGIAAALFPFAMHGVVDANAHRYPHVVTQASSTGKRAAGAHATDADGAADRESDAEAARAAAATEQAVVPGLAKLVVALLVTAGLFLLLFGALNYYTHVGMIVNELELGMRP
ncbi:DUF981 family protein [Brachybacterium sp. Marseille-Q2903]|uniref:DUF981 family protein n=1 Tax=Brachybacterium epidermidis TaxID=2781983 RepID=A0ABR9W0F8_9MICO|nr:DUF981 family protein [Brachybacterium epidermidis]